MRFINPNCIPGCDDHYIEKVDPADFKYVDEMHYEIDGWVSVTKPVVGYNDCCDSDEIEVWEYGIEKIDAQCACYRNFEGKRTLVCLMERASFALWLGTNDSCYLKDDELADFLKKEAMDAGFPEQLPTGMTWRDIRDQLNAIKDDTILDMTAGVWLYDDCKYDMGGFNLITSLQPYDASEHGSKTNELSFTIKEM